MSVNANMMSLEAGSPQLSCSEPWHRRKAVTHNLYIGWSDVTVSVVTLRSLCRGGNTAYCVKWNDEDLSRCSNKIELDGLRKCPYYHCITKKAVSQKETFRWACLTLCHRYGTKNLRQCHHMYFFAFWPIPMLVPPAWYFLLAHQASVGRLMFCFCYFLYFFFLTIVWNKEISQTTRPIFTKF